jgi:hypothetical protein
MAVIATSLLEECGDNTHTPKMGTWESSGIPETSEFDYRGQKTSHWNILYIIGNLSKRRCRKWAHMSHLDICSTSYGKRKGRESNWQFDFRPLKVENQLDPNACRWIATHHWKNLDESYKPRLFLDSSLGVPGQKKTIRMYVPWRDAENTMWRKVIRLPLSLGHGEFYESKVVRGLS